MQQPQDTTAERGVAPGAPRAFRPLDLELPDGLRVRVREIELDDADRWARHVRADLEHLGVHLGWPALTAEPEGARAFIARYAVREGGRTLLLGAFGEDDELVAGTVLMAHDAAVGAIELGCWGVRAVEGRGLVRRLCLETLRHARGALGVHRVAWTAASGNERSLGLAGRLGFVHEGRLREAGLHLGRRQDLDVLALVGSEIDRALEA